MTIKAVLFDLDDTLLWDDRSVQEAFDATCGIAAHCTRQDAKVVENAVRTRARELYASYPTFEFTKMIGINPFEGLWAPFRRGEQPEFRQLESLAPTYRRDSWTGGLQSLGVPDMIAVPLGAELAEIFPAERRKRPYVYDETFRVLDALKQRGLKLLLLTNGSPDLQQEKLDGVPQLAPYFDHIVISGNWGRGKPDPSIFEHAMTLLGITSAEGIMVGDKLTTDILGANKVGMTSVWVNRHDAPRSDEIVPTHEVSNLEQLFALLK